MTSIRYIVTDIDRSVEFYRDKLEFSVDMHNPGKFAALIRDDLTLYLSAPRAGSGGTAGGNPEPGGWNRFMIITNDIDGLIGRLNIRLGSVPACTARRFYLRGQTSSGRPGMSVSCQFQT